MPLSEHVLRGSGAGPKLGPQGQQLQTRRRKRGVRAGSEHRGSLFELRTLCRGVRSCHRSTAGRRAAVARVILRNAASPRCEPRRFLPPPIATVESFSTGDCPMADTPTFGRYAEIPYDQMTPEQQDAYRSLI